MSMFGASPHRVGFRFRPNDDELISFYLSRKMHNQPLPYNGIRECDVYGDKCPWQIFDEKKKHYVFTTLKKASKNRVARSAGVGTWHGNNSGVQICDAKNKKKVIGLKKTFTFKVKPKSKKDDCIMNEAVGNWIMHEYSLVSGEKCSDLVLCSIHKKIKKSSDEKEEEEEEEDYEDNDWDVDDESEALNRSTETSVNEREAASTSMTVMISPDATQSLCSVDVGEYGMGNSPASDPVTEAQAQLKAVYEYLMRDDELPALRGDEFLNRSTETPVNEREAASTSMTVMIPPDATQSLCSVDVGEYGMEREVPSTAMTVMIPPDATQPLSSVDVGEYGMGNPPTSDDLAQLSAVHEYLMRDDELLAFGEDEFSMPGWTGFVDYLMDCQHQPVQENNVFLPTAMCT